MIVGPEDYTELDAFIQQVTWAILGNASHPYQTAEIALEASQIVGDLVECGVFAGAQSAIMHQVCPDKNIHLLDSFQGIPHPTEKDIEICGDVLVSRDGELASTGVSVCSVEQVIAFLYAWGCNIDKFLFHKGWIEYILPTILVEKIAMLRIDVDLYRPTKLCLEHFYRDVTEGGYILVHDVDTLTGCDIAVKEFFTEKKLDYSRVHHLADDGGIYWRKGEV